MTELVAERTNTVTNAFFTKLGRAYIAEDCLSVQLGKIFPIKTRQSVCAALIQCSSQIPAVWPNSFRQTAFRLAFSCIEEVDDVHRAVTVAVVLAEVAACFIRSKHGINHEVRHVFVISIFFLAGGVTICIYYIDIAMLAVINHIMR